MYYDGYNSIPTLVHRIEDNPKKYFTSHSLSHQAGHMTEWTILCTPPLAVLNIIEKTLPIYWSGKNSLLWQLAPNFLLRLSLCRPNQCSMDSQRDNGRHKFNWYSSAKCPYLSARNRLHVIRDKRRRRVFWPRKSRYSSRCDMYARNLVLRIVCHKWGSDDIVWFFFSCCQWVLLFLNWNVIHRLVTWTPPPLLPLIIIIVIIPNRYSAGGFCQPHHGPFHSLKRRLIRSRRALRVRQRRSRWETTGEYYTFVLCGLIIHGIIMNWWTR